MKTYYSLRCPTPVQSPVRSTVDPVLALVSIVAICATLWFGSVPAREQQSVAMTASQIR